MSEYEGKHRGATDVRHGPDMGSYSPCGTRRTAAQVPKLRSMRQIRALRE